MNDPQKKGAIFEKIIKYHIKAQGYEIIPNNIMNYYGVRKRHNGLNVKGRGGWHQIDALGQLQFQIPFVYPIRLLSEAKCYEKKIGLPIIRNFVGVLKDISENYFIDNYSELQYKERFRFTDCGVVFSTSAFSKNAQMYAYAQGVYLVQMQEFKIFIDKELTIFNSTNISFKKFLKELGCGKSLKYCYFGLASGFYPIAIISNSELPLDIFLETDEVLIRIYYYYTEQITNERELSREIYEFKIQFNNWVGRFQLPRYIWEKYMKLPDFKEAMLNMKEAILNYIDIPIKINNIRRIIRLKIDKSWIDAIRERDHKKSGGSIK